jgi:hypothetical protein
MRIVSNRMLKKEMSNFNHEQWNAFYIGVLYQLLNKEGSQDEPSN